MRKSILIIAVLGVALLSFDMPKSAYKKIDKTIAALWENIEVIKEVVKVPTNNTLSFKLKEETVFKLKNNTNILGYYYLTAANSKADKFDYMIVFNPDLSILKVQMLVYREDYGGEIGSKRWLKQFIGKINGQKMKFGHDVQNISGATVSARSITNDIEKTSIRMQELKDKGLL